MKYLHNHYLATTSSTGVPGKSEKKENERSNCTKLQTFQKKNTQIKKETQKQKKKEKAIRFMETCK